MKENTNPAPLSEVLHTFFKTYLNKTDQGFGIKLWQNWPKFASTEILKHTKPVSYQSGRLVLWSANSVEIQELSFQVEDLKQAINNYFGKVWVKDIYFTVNKDILNKRENSFHILQKISKEFFQEKPQKNTITT